MSCTAVEEAVLLTCDVPTRQYILHVNEEQQKEQRCESFVIRQLDATHLYVKAHCLPLLQRKMEELQNTNTFTRNDAGPGLSSLGDAAGGADNGGPAGAPPAKRSKKKAGA